MSSEQHKNQFQEQDHESSESEEVLITDFGEDPIEKLK